MYPTKEMQDKSATANYNGVSALREIGLNGLLHLIQITCWQLWLQLERSWIFQWRTPCKKKKRKKKNIALLYVITRKGDIMFTPSAGGSHTSIHCFLPHLHNNYLRCKHRPSVEKPCQLPSDLRVSFSDWNAGCDSFNWFLSLQTHLSNLFPSLTPSFVR